MSKLLRRFFVCLLVLPFISLSFPVCAQESLPISTAYKILSPRFFPGWQAQHVASPFVLYDSTDRHYKMYYSGSSSTQVNESIWDQWVTGLVTSSNTIDWKYPDNYEPVLFAKKLMEGEVLNPADYSNTFDAVCAVDAFILKEGSVYKAWFTGWNGETKHEGNGITKKINRRIGYATSTDGVNWTKIKGNCGAGAVLGVGESFDPDQYGAEDPYVISHEGMYKMWYTGFDGDRRRILYATSVDGINWEKKGVALSHGGASDSDELNVQSPVVVKRKGMYELWYQGESLSAPHSRTLRSISRDGITWQKAGEVKLHPVAPQPSWPWTSLSARGTEKTTIGNIIVHPDNSCQVFYATQFTGARSVTYGEITAPLSFIFTERVNP
jgi:hypothetical protein